MDKEGLENLLNTIQSETETEVIRLKGERDNAPDEVDFLDNANSKEYYEGMIEGILDGYMIARNYIKLAIEKAK